MQNVLSYTFATCAGFLFLAGVVMLRGEGNGNK